jgi:nucleotide-binding universal stress UspA family protein
VFDTILVGTDGSTTASVAVAHATELARLFAGTLHVASVTKPVPRSAVESAALDDFTEDARRVLDRAAEPARAAGVRVETHPLMGAPAHALVELAAEVHADVIVVGNRGMTGSRRFLGSVPNAVTHHAPCSVLIVETQHHT